MATRYFILSFFLLLTACGQEERSQVSIPSMIDFGRAYFFVPQSTRNRLYISIDSRMTLSGNTNLDLLLLSHHPRENTFQNDGHIYDDVITASQGASLVTFMFDQNRDETIIHRRFDVPTSPSKTCGPSPYSGGMHQSPRGVPSEKLRDISNTGVIDTAYRGNRILGEIEYHLNGTDVRIQFPVGVMNINPVPHSAIGKQWQAATALIPIYIPGATTCDSVTNGYAAFSEVGTSIRVEFVYLCDVYSPRESQDYTCTMNVSSTVKLYEVVD